MVGFAFTELLGFRLLPRFKNIGSIKLYSPDEDPATWKNLERVIVNRPIVWDKITQQYDQMVKYATALRLGRPRPSRCCAGSPRAVARKAPPNWRWKNSGG